MSALTAIVRRGGGSEPGARVDIARAVRRDAWTVALWGLLVALLVVTRLIKPIYGPVDVQYLAIAALPVGLAAVGQAIVVIGGGIDLSVASLMTLTSVTAAVLMKGRPDEFAALVVVLVLAEGVVLGAINGGLVVLTKVPDIVVTLAMSYVWAGAALLVLPTPGGAAADWLMSLITGGLIIEWLPMALVLLTVAVGIVWIPLRRSRLGLSIYAVGSDRLAAFRTGVDVTRTKVATYALGGLFAAAGGLALTMSTGIGTPTPGPYMMLSVAAIVLGGVSLAGGRGGIVGPIVAVFVLSLIRTDLTFVGIDPNYTTVIQGAIMVVVVMIGAFMTLRRRRA